MNYDDSPKPEDIDQVSPIGTLIAAQNTRRPSPKTAALRRILHSCRTLLPTLAIMAGIALILGQHGQDVTINIAGVALVVGGVWDHA